MATPSTQEDLLEELKVVYARKVFVLGDEDTGKSNVIERYVHGKFTEQRSTIGCDLTFKEINWDEYTLVRLDIWETEAWGRQTQFKHDPRALYQGVAAAFFVFDVTDPDGLEVDVRRDKMEFDECTSPVNGKPVPCVLLANKCDQANWMYSSSQMDSFCKEHGFACWFTTSARENINIEEAFKFLVYSILMNVMPDYSDGCCQVHLASGAGNLCDVEFLLAKDPSQLTARSNDGRAPVHFAARSGDLGTIQFLLDMDARQLSWRDAAGFYPIHFAAIGGKLDMVMFLLVRDPSQVTALTNGRTLLDEFVLRYRSQCVQLLMDFMWSNMETDQATLTIQEAVTEAKKKSINNRVHLLESFLVVKAFSGDGVEPAMSLKADLIGAGGSGKTTFIESMVTTARIQQLMRRENHEDTECEDVSRRTKGISTVQFVDSLGHAITFRDMAGQEQFATTHDVFSIMAQAPSASIIFVNATHRNGYVIRHVQKAAGDILSKMRAAGGSDPHPVMVIASRRDKVDDNRVTEVNEIVNGALHIFQDYIRLMEFFCLDCRRARTAQMKKFRIDFPEVVQTILNDSPLQPTLLRKADSLLAGVRKHLPLPFSTKREFLQAYCELKNSRVPDNDDGLDTVSKSLCVLTAYGKVVTFDQDPLGDIVVNDPSWLLEDVVGRIFSPKHFPEPHVHFEEGRARTQVVVDILDNLTPGHGRKLTDMLIQLGVIVESRDDIIVPSFLPEADSPLQRLLPLHPAAVVCGLEYVCDSMIPFNTASVVQMQTHMYDYCRTFHDSPAILQKNVVTVHPRRLTTTGAVFFSPTRLRAYIVVAAIECRHAVSFLQLLRTKFLEIVSKYSAGTGERKDWERVLSPKSIRAQLSSPDIVMESYRKESVRVDQSTGDSMVTPSRQHTDDALEVPFLPVTHARLLPAESKAKLLAVIRSIPVSCLTALLQVNAMSLAAAGDVEQVSHSSVLDVWLKRSESHSTAKLLNILAASGQVPANCLQLVQDLRQEEKNLGEGFPDIFYHNHMQTIGQLDSDAGRSGASDGTSVGSSPQTGSEVLSYLHQTPCIGQLQIHLREMNASTDVVEDIPVLLSEEASTDAAEDIQVVRSDGTSTDVAEDTLAMVSDDASTDVVEDFVFVDDASCAAVASAGPSGHDEDDNPWNSQVFRDHYHFLVGNLTPAIARVHCAGKGLITWPQAKQLSHVSDPATHNEALLLNVQAGNRDSFQLFCDIIREHEARFTFERVIVAFDALQQT